ncbi:MAG: hypothetical protein HF976_03025 [ANME-2 cluster archaeon]|nr:hypothetical protein [ANME-2 cluster archaeon]
MERRRVTPGRDPYPTASHSWSAWGWPWHFSERSSGRSRLRLLFLDEGFGTLDSETPDAALNALESLWLSGRTIGVIQPHRLAYPAHTCEDRCEKDRGRDINYTC